jgi:hypothetical protein
LIAEKQVNLSFFHVPASFAYHYQKIHPSSAKQEVQISEVYYNLASRSFGPPFPGVPLANARGLASTTSSLV